MLIYHSALSLSRKTGKIKKILIYKNVSVHVDTNFRKKMNFKFSLSLKKKKKKETNYISNDGTTHYTCYINVMSIFLLEK